MRTKMHDYGKLLRPKHYIKNLLIFIPLFFDLNIFDSRLLIRSIYGFFIFSLLASAIYIMNDIHDMESDRQHEEKRNRPLASGVVSVKEAAVLVFMLVCCIVFLNIFTDAKGWYWLLLYFVLNLLYSMKLKNIPLLDVVILVSGFLIRILYGSAVTGIAVSFWLCMTVLAASFYLGFGKRRNELIKKGNDADKVRGVLKFYNGNFLDKNMYMCMSMAVIFYAMWSGADSTIGKTGGSYQMWTVPLVMVIAMRYSLDIESGEYADPVEVILGDRMLLLLGMLYSVCMFFILYVI